jgi:hypothetical protein
MDVRENIVQIKIHDKKMMLMILPFNNFMSHHRLN